jgi:ADP-heptose:LPS heptosyltransferase
MRIVIYRSGALGDTLLAFPALHLLRRHWPDAQVTLICRAGVHALALASGLADRTFSHELAAWACLFDEGVQVAELARETFAGADLALVWSPDGAGAIASRLNALGAREALIAEPPPQAGSQRHVALQLLDALAPLGIDIPAEDDEMVANLPALRWPQMAQDEVAAAGENIRAELAGRPPVAIHPGSGGASKRWPPGHFAALIRGLRRDFAPVLIAGPQDEKIVAQVSAAAGAIPVVRDVSVAGLAAFLSEYAISIGNDSGVTHLAGMLGVPTVALFGPTDPALWAPLGRRVVALRSSTGQMEDLPLEVVVAAVQEVRRLAGG